MRWFGGIVVVLVVLVGAFLYGGLGRETWNSRFRITVEVETPNGLRTGSSVVEMRTERDSGFLVPHEARGARSRIRGEAVFVDLGPDKDGKPQNLIALLAFGKNGENPNFAFLIARAFFNVNPHQGTMGFGGYAARLEELPVGTRAVLKPSNMPTLVSFADLSDPTSARVVSPKPDYAYETGFEPAFGRGFRLRAIAIERVRSSFCLPFGFCWGGRMLTKGIDRKLQWMAKPLPWLRPSSGTGYIDTRPKDGNSYRLQTYHFMRR